MLQDSHSTYNSAFFGFPKAFDLIFVFALAIERKMRVFTENIYSNAPNSIRSIPNNIISQIKKK